MNLFDVIGPVMIGPSSSHTAGAVRLAKLALAVLGEPVAYANIGLHGSFSQTYKGHGTDLALIAGLLGWNPDDVRIPQAFLYADKAAIRIEFKVIQLGEKAHPNSVRFLLKGAEGQCCTVTGSSIGGGRVLISEIDGFPLAFTGEFPSLLTIHQDKPGVIAQVTSILSRYDVNVAQMKVFRKEKGGLAAMIVETDQLVDEEAWLAVNNLVNVQTVRRIQAI